jgi:hypothetical protein
MAAIQEVSAPIGRVTGRGLAVPQLDGLESEWRTRYAHYYELRSLSETERLARVVAHLGDPKT